MVDGENTFQYLEHSMSWHMETDTVMQHNNTHELAEAFPFDGQHQGVEGL
jgi:hypothetical protein